MFIFITTLRHPKNSISYKRVETLLERTVKSVCNQTNRNFRFIVVGNQLPQFPSVPSEMDFVRVDFKPPSALKGSKLDINDCRTDKATKYFIGLLHARQYNPEYVMFLDADDVVSNKITEYANSHPDRNGWLIDKGYIYGDGGVLIRWTKEFHMKCGTSRIVNWKLLNVPSNFPAQPNQNYILRNVDSNFLRKVLGIHRETESYFRNIGFPLEPLPFYGAIWILDTGENRSGKSLMRIGYPVSSKIRKEFNLELPKVNFKFLITYFLGLPFSMAKLTLKIWEKLRIALSI